MPTTSVSKLSAADVIFDKYFSDPKLVVRYQDWELKRQWPDGSNEPKIFVCVTNVAHRRSANYYKVRISVHPDSLETALNLLIPKLFSSDSPFPHFKIANTTAATEKKSAKAAAGKRIFQRLVIGGQITLYCSNVHSAVHYADFVSEITALLERNKIRVSIIPESDFAISNYISGRCELEADSSGRLHIDKPSTRKHISTSTRQAYLFRLMQLYETVRFKIARLSDDKTRAAAQKLVDSFKAKYADDLTTHHHDLIFTFISEVCDPLNTLLERPIDFAIAGIKDKADWPGYFKCPRRIVASESGAASGGGAAAAGSAEILSALSSPKNTSVKSTRKLPKSKVLPLEKTVEAKTPQEDEVVEDSEGLCVPNCCCS